MSEGHDENGRFANGNLGGPGRPRRAIERQYLAAISEACPPDAWREVVDRAVADAKQGDHQARAWLGKYVLGEKPISLLDLAAAEARGLAPDDEVRDASVRQAQEAERQSQFGAILGRLQ